MPVRPDIVVGYAKPKAKAKRKAKPLIGTQGPARRGASQPKGPVARPKAKAKPKPKVDTGNILDSANAKGQRLLVGQQYPSGKQSKAGLVVKRNERTIKRDTALHAFDQAKGTPAERRAAAVAAVEGETKMRRARAQRTAKAAAPVLSVLNQTTRPLHAIAGATDAAIAGKNVPKAALRGLQNKDKTTFSKPLRRLGVPKGVAGAAGLGLDIVADPTTYVTLGTGTIGRKALEAAATTSAGKVARKIASDVNPKIAPEGVDKKVWQQATSAARSARSTQAATAREAQRHATALRKSMGTHDETVVDAVESKTIDQLPEHLRPAARRMRDDYAAVNAAEKAHGVKGGTVREIHPMAVPEKTSAVADSAKSVAKARRARATAERRHRAAIGASGEARGRAAVQSRSVAGTRAERRAEVASRRAERQQPVEPGTFAAGGHGVRQSADDLQRTAADVKTTRKAQADAEAAHADVLAAARSDRRLRHIATEHNLRAAVAPKAYVPHYTTESLATGVPSEARGSVGRRTVGSGSNKARAKGRAIPLAQLRKEHPGVYNEDAALAYANRMTLGGKSVSQAQLNRRLADLGRPFERGVVEPGPEDGVYRLRGANLTEITDKAELQRLATKTGLNKGDDRYVILHRRVVEHAHATSSPSDVAGPILQWYDRQTGRFKFIATQPNPGFHLRNLVGDTQNAYLAQPGHRIPGNMVRAGKALRAQTHAHEAQRTLGATAKEIRGGVKIDGKTMSYADLAAEAERVGAIGSGFTQRELPDLMHAGQQGIEQGVKKLGRDGRVKRTVKRTIQSREDLPRLTTYIDGRRRGMTPEQAATHAADFHFDYANLTRFERGARRVVPFYTFTARNVPLQAKMLLKKPGKYANYQKVREEAANTAGLQPGWEDDLKPWEARNAPIPFSFHGKKYTASAGLPIADLNEFPTTLNPVKLVDEWFQKAASVTNPIIKDPIELWANYSAFFRGPIRRDAQSGHAAPLVAAPSFVGAWPAPIRKKLGIVKIDDPKTGAKIWAWDAKVNYVAHAVPGPQQTAQNLASGTDQAGRGTKEKLLSAAGVKTAPIDPAATKINALYDEMNRIQTKLGALAQQGIKRPTSSPEREALNLQIRKIERQIYELARKRGDKKLPVAGRPRVARPSSGGLGGGLGGGGLGGSLGGGGF